MRTNLSSQISLNRVSPKYYKPENAVERSVLTRCEKVPTDIYETMEEGVQQIANEITAKIQERQREGKFCVIGAGELETIRTLVDAGQVVIAAGGGGIPVMEQGIDLHGASAIIEKDLSSGLLAQELNADTLLILTSVEKVSLNLGQDNEEYLNTISVDDAKKYMADNQFAPGSTMSGSPPAC